jgi:hypothetical protein
VIAYNAHPFANAIFRGGAAMRMTGLLVIVTVAMSTSLVAGQWLTHRDPQLPRSRDGQPNLAAPTPRTNGHPDLSGVWQVEPTARAEMQALFGDIAAVSVLGDDTFDFSKYFLNILADFPPSASPMRPETADLFKRLTATRGTSSPTANCLPPGLTQADLFPMPHKIIQTPSVIVALYEGFGGHRQIYLDGRSLPTDPQPLWLGYSVGHWEGETLVADSRGFNDKSRLDGLGHPHSEALHVIERFHRRDLGHMDVSLTVDDPQMYLRPFTVNVVDRLVPDSDVGEFFCAENEKDRAHMGK